MATFRTQNHVPDVYIKGSRDFQLFCNLFDCVNGSLKYDIDSICDVTDTNQCNERLMPYLQTKLGFWTDVKIRAENLRTIMKGFIYAVRNKGSIKGVEQAVQIFLKIAKIKTNVHIEVINEPKNGTQDSYTVIIGTEQYLGDTTILDEILRYILPAGYAHRYVYYADTSFETLFNYHDTVRLITGNYNYANAVPGQALLGAVRTTYVNNKDGKKVEVPNIINNINQTMVSSNRVPLWGDSYNAAPQIKNPPVIDNGASGVEVEENAIIATYKESFIGEQKDGN